MNYGVQANKMHTMNEYYKMMMWSIEEESLFNHLFIQKMYSEHQ